MFDITLIKKEPVKTQFKGSEVLQLPSGSILVVGSRTSLFEDEPLLLMRTSCDKHPLIALSDGKLWGSDLNGYNFTLQIDVQQIVLTPAKTVKFDIETNNPFSGFDSIFGNFRQLKDIFLEDRMGRA